MDITNENKHKEIISGLAMLVIFLALALIAQVLYDFIPLSNIQNYMLILMISCAIFVITYRTIKIEDLQLIEKLPRWKIVTVVTVLLLGNVILIIMSFLKEQSLPKAPDYELSLYHQNNTLSIIIGVVILCFIFIILKKVGRQYGTASYMKVIIIFIIVISGIVLAYSIYAPNAFFDYYSRYHQNAYFNSIFSALDGMPRTELNSSIYGFYGIMLTPFIKLLGGNVEAVNIVVAAIEIITFLCIVYSIIGLVKRNYLRILSIMALVVYSSCISEKIYMQMNPQRVFFPAIIIAFIVFLYKHNVRNIISTILGYLICSLAIMWNVETGIVCLLSFSCYLFLRSLRKYSFKDKKLYLNTADIVILCIISLVAAWFTIGLVNISMGGELLSVKDFVFPLFNKEYISGDLMMPPPSGIVSWMFIAGMAILLVNVGFSRIKLCREEQNNRITRVEIIMTLGTLILGMLLYYVNRPTYGSVSIVYYETILMMAVIGDYCINEYVNSDKEINLVNILHRGVASIISAVLLLLIIAGAVNFNTLREYRSDNEYKDLSTLRKVEQEISEYCPKDTRAMGISLGSIYCDINWNQHYYMLDFADLRVNYNVYKYVLEELNKNLNEPILIDNEALKIITKYDSKNIEEFFNRYEIDKTFHLYDQEIYYYVPK